MASPARVGVVVLFVIFSLYHLSTYRYQISSSLLSPIQNSTLGFGAILLISLPERTDRRDVLSLISSTSNITITHTIDAVKGENIIAKVRPYGKAVGTLDEGHWGSWRSHLDALKYIVDNRIETAIILEDDVDWEPRIRDQMMHLADGIQSSPLMMRSNQNDAAKYPYGTDWDVMHLGVSRVTAAPKPFEKIHIPYHDSTLPAGPVKDLDCHEGKPWYCFEKYIKTLQIPDQSRAIIPSYEPIGLVSIAVTLKGAQKLMYYLSWKSLDSGLDWSIRDLSKSGDIESWTVMPPLFGSWTTGSSADSDLREGALVKGSAPNNLLGKPRGLRESARQHLNDLVGNEKAWERLRKSIEPRS